jgi:hypothetical protein
MPTAVVLPANPPEYVRELMASASQTRRCSYRPPCGVRACWSRGATRVAWRIEDGDLGAKRDLAALRPLVYAKFRYELSREAAAKRTAHMPYRRTA